MWVNWDSFILLIRELSCPLSFNLLPCTYLLKLPDMHVLFLLMLQRYFAISSASLCSLKAVTPLNIHQCRVEPSWWGDAVLPKKPLLLWRPSYTEFMQKGFHSVWMQTACLEAGAALTLPVLCVSTRFAPPSREQQRGTCGSELFLLIWHYIQIL